MQQFFQGALGQAKSRPKLRRLLHQGEVFCRHGLQAEAAFAAFEEQFVLVRLQHHRLIAGHGAQDVDQFACGHRGGKVARVPIQFDIRADLDFQIAGGELQL